MLATRKIKGKVKEILGDQVDADEVKTMLSVYGLLYKSVNLNSHPGQLKIFEIGVLSTALDHHQEKGISAIVKRSLGFIRDLGYEWARINCSLVRSWKSCMKVFFFPNR